MDRASRLRAHRIGQIVEGKRNVSPDTALHLGRYFGTGPEFWINPQARYELETAKGALVQAIDREMPPRSAA